MVKKERIKSFDGLKFIAMLLIFYWHSGLPRPDCDLGARCCEFFFVVSGFSVGYNCYGTDFPNSLKDGIRYYLKKMVTIWPLHVFCLFLDLLFTFNIPLSIGEFKTFILNLFLLQSWSNDSSVFFSYNGVSWFLSSLIFCYLFVPLLLKTINSLKNSTVLLVLVSLVRVFWESFSVKGLIPFSVSFHTFPPVRLLEFYLGMLIVPLFFKISKYIKNTLVFSTMEIIVLLGTCLLIIFYNDLLRGIYVIAFCILIFIFAFQKGIVSRVLSIKPFINFSKIQIVFFLLHQELLYITHSLLASLFQNDIVIFVSQFVITVLCSLLLYALLKKDSLQIKIIEKINKF